MPNPLLLSGGALSLCTAVLHLGCIAFGASWYRFLGAGEPLARLADASDWRPTVFAVTLAMVLTVWALYAFSGAGLMARLPLLRLGLCTITGIALLRGLGGLVVVAHPLGTSPQCWGWSSAFARRSA